MHHSALTGFALIALLLSELGSAVAAALPDAEGHEQHVAVAHHTQSIDSVGVLPQRPGKHELVTVPIPSALLLLGSGVIGLISVTRRKT